MTDDYRPSGSAFTGTIDWVQIDLDEPPRTPTT